MSKASHQVIVHELYKGLARIENNRVTINYPEDFELNDGDRMVCSFTRGSADTFDVAITVIRADNERIALSKLMKGRADYYDISIDELDLNVRAWRFLRRDMNVSSIGGVLDLSAEDLIRIRGCGRKTVNVIALALKQYGLQLRKGSRNPSTKRLLRGADDV